MPLSASPQSKPQQQRHPIDSIKIKTIQIESVCGDRTDSKGNLIKKNPRYWGHWIRGLSSTGEHRWTLTQDQIVYGIEPPKDGFQFASDRAKAYPNMRGMWADLVNAVEPEFREARNP
jgi:hypothetical protein